MKKSTQTVWCAELCVESTEEARECLFTLLMLPILFKQLFVKLYTPYLCFSRSVFV